ncbi:MAG: DUF1624 domain-containing protein [Candidatus Aenigmarchaeota archaeon]|nr:DUF1624 domain-containing protein [Candidatus Aenigmarchaeota archaeon]
MRFYEIDYLRGAAILMMIIFHFFYDLKFLKIFYFESTLFWWLFPRLIATMFIFLVGVSLSISYSRTRKKSEKEILKKYLSRGLVIFFWGLVITLATKVLIGEGFIIFGILHLIGLSIILAYPFLRYRTLNLYIGTGLIFLGWYLATFRFPFSSLLWLGFVPSVFYTIDYFPLLPWFGLVLIGMFFGNTLYPQGKRSFNVREIKTPVTDLLGLLGRNSLKIYIIHQPVLIAILAVLFLL